MSLIAGSPTRSPHVITLWFDFFPRGITNGYWRGRARSRTAFLFVSLVARTDFLRSAGPRGKEGRKEGKDLWRRNADEESQDNRLYYISLLPSVCSTHQSRLSAPTTSSRLGNRGHLNQRRTFTATNRRNNAERFDVLESSRDTSFYGSFR